MNWINLFIKAGKLWLKTGAGHLSAALSYYIPFALTPLIFISVYLVGMVSGHEKVSKLLYSWGEAMDVNLAKQLSESVTKFGDLTNSYDLPLIITLFFSGMIVVAINMVIYGIQQIWGINPKGWQAYFYQLIRLAIFFVILQAYIFLVIVLEDIVSLIVSLTGISTFTYLGSLLLFLTTAILCLFAYSILPARVYSLKARLVGSLLATALFVVSKYFVSAQLLTTPLPGLFGTAGTIFILLIWIYSLSVIIFYVAAFIRVYDESRGRHLSR